ncbi:hypothetical protein MLD38_037812 [Melastoma candidum]|uniref:Uncharacterized protein n=1 Tax=Melastoma candidum TaxID=119954 RepID=A0ACB9LP53_9MYRT|nr:hypothetical protein MLD38_037812 [Melastoma candidum]
MQTQGFIEGFSPDSEPNRNIAGTAVVLGPSEERRETIYCGFTLLATDQKAYGYSETFCAPATYHIWIVYVPLRMIWGLQGNLDDDLGKHMVIFHSSNKWAMKSMEVKYVLKQGRMYAVSRLEQPSPGLDHRCTARTVRFVNPET